MLLLKNNPIKTIIHFFVFGFVLSNNGYTSINENPFREQIKKILEDRLEDIPNPFYHVEKTTRTIIKWGPPILSHVYEEQKNGDPGLDGYMSYVMKVITKKEFLDRDGKTDERMEYRDSYAELWIQWWEKERFYTEESFDALYDIWKRVPNSNRFLRPTAVDYLSTYSQNDLKFQQWENMPDGPEKRSLDPFTRTAYQQVLDLGIPALPYAIEKIKEGDADLIEAVNYWTDDALKKSAEEKGIAADDMCAYCVEWWEANKEYWLLPPVEGAEKE